MEVASSPLASVRQKHGHHVETSVENLQKLDEALKGITQEVGLSFCTYCSTKSASPITHRKGGGNRESLYPGMIPGVVPFEVLVRSHKYPARPAVALVATTGGRGSNIENQLPGVIVFCHTYDKRTCEGTVLERLRIKLDATAITRPSPRYCGGMLRTTSCDLTGGENGEGHRRQHCSIWRGDEVPQVPQRPLVRGGKLRRTQRGRGLPGMRTHHRWTRYPLAEGP